MFVVFFWGALSRGVFQFKKVKISAKKRRKKEEECGDLLLEKKRMDGMRISSRPWKSHHAILHILMDILIRTNRGVHSSQHFRSYIDAIDRQIDIERDICIMVFFFF